MYISFGALPSLTMLSNIYTFFVSTYIIKNIVPVKLDIAYILGLFTIQLYAKLLNWYMHMLPFSSS